MTDEHISSGRAKWVAGFWALAFCITLAGMILLAVNLQLPPIAKILMMLAPMLLMIPMVRSTERVQAACGNNSKALRRYNRRALIWSFGYGAALFFAIYAFRTWHPTGPIGWAIGILPALPLFFFIWSMGAYLVEEQDEYLRQRAMIGALWGTGVLLAAATGYGFLEMFKLVPHVDSWMAVPVWAVGLGIGNLVMRGRS